jgi:WD40 repeat protein
VRRWEAHRFGVTQVLWHPWDELLASAGQDGKAKLWRSDGAEPIAVPEAGNAWCEHLAWAPSGKVLLNACGKQLKLWSREGELLRVFAEQPHTIAGIGWWADSQRFVSACYGRVVFWLPEAVEPTRILEWKGLDALRRSQS